MRSISHKSTYQLQVVSLEKCTPTPVSLCISPQFMGWWFRLAENFLFIWRRLRIWIIRLFLLLHAWLITPRYSKQDSVIRMRSGPPPPHNWPVSCHLSRRGVTCYEESHTLVTSATQDTQHTATRIFKMCLMSNVNCMIVCTWNVHGCFMKLIQRNRKFIIK